MLFRNIVATLHHFHSLDSGSLTKLKDTQVAAVAKYNPTRDGRAFTHEKPCVAAPRAPLGVTTSAVAAAPSLASFGCVVVGCACCCANVYLVKYSCSICYWVVNEACMQLVEPNAYLLCL